MIIYVDIDETICSTPGDISEARDYSKAIPIEENISAVNDLYDKGNTIIYWTARGTGSGIDWSHITEKQFERWGVKFHRLAFGKPIYDLLICDKAINTRRWEDENEN